MKRVLVVFVLLWALTLHAAEIEQEQAIEHEPFRFNPKSYVMNSLELAWKGSYMQFHGTQNKIFAAIALMSVGYFLHNDDRLSQKVTRRNTNVKLLRVISDASIFFNTPVIPFGFYSWGIRNHDEKMVRFSEEYLGAMVLALLETAAISLVPVHQRPDQKELSFWETAFRGQSSFPSGHVIGYGVLTMKSLQFYGPHYALIPALLAAATAFERVHGEKHYASDVIASGFITLMASEGVRYASKYHTNHPVYEWIFNHDFSLQYIRIDDAPGLRVGWRY